MFVLLFKLNINIWTMKKYMIELTEEQMKLVANCLEDISRFASGQTNLNFTISEMTKDLPFEEQINRRDYSEQYLKQLKRILLPELSEHASNGYNKTEFIGNTYQIYRTILHKLAVDNNLNNAYSSEPLPSGTMGTINITLK